MATSEPIHLNGSDATHRSRPLAPAIAVPNQVRPPRIFLSRRARFGSLAAVTHPPIHPLVLGEEALTLEAIAGVARARRPVRLGAAARARIGRARAAIERIAAGGAAAPAVYGVNT